MYRKIWIQLRSSLWFVPGVLVFVAIALALGLVELDVVFFQPLHARSWQPLLNAGAEGARGMLTAIASSMITVAGVAFSVTIVTLSLASTQYTPRILRTFMRDRANQYVLGVFVAVFAYCLIVLRTIRGGAEQDGGGFVPLLAVTFGVLLALLSIGCLIFFIHHVAASIQASSILKAITDETATAIDSLYPETMGAEAEPATPSPGLAGTEWRTILSQETGYLQNVDGEGLLHFAVKSGCLLRLERNPGDFVAVAAPLVSADCVLDDAASATLRAFFVVGDFRTVEQDAGFGLRQIVDIAMKALSPGINDTSTGVSCLDYLSAILSRLAPRHLGSPLRQAEGPLRVITSAPSFTDHLAKAFDEIRLSADGNVSILIAMLCALQRIARQTAVPLRRGSLLQHARLIVDTADRTVHVAYDRQRVNMAIAELGEALSTEGSLPSLTPDPTIHS